MESIHAAVCKLAYFSALEAGGISGSYHHVLANVSRLAGATTAHQRFRYGALDCASILLVIHSLLMITVNSNTLDMHYAFIAHSKPKIITNIPKETERA